MIRSQVQWYERRLATLILITDCPFREHVHKWWLFKWLMLNDWLVRIFFTFNMARGNFGVVTGVLTFVRNVHWPIIYLFHAYIITSYWSKWLLLPSPNWLSSFKTLHFSFIDWFIRRPLSNHQINMNQTNWFSMTLVFVINFAPTCTWTKKNIRNIWYCGTFD